MEELLTLPGVGRKTANLVLILSFKQPEEHLRRHARAPHLEPPRLGADANAGGDRAGALQAHARAVVAVHQPVSGDVGAERLPAGLSRAAACASIREHCPQIGVTQGVEAMTETTNRGDRCVPRCLFAVFMRSRGWRGRRATASLAQSAGPVIVVETSKGHVRVRDLSRRGAEDGRAHRRAREARVLRRPARPSRAARVSGAVGRPAVARRRARGRLGPRPRRVERQRRSASPRSRGSGCTPAARWRWRTRAMPAQADSQIYVTLADRPDLERQVHGLRPGRRRRGRAGAARARRRDQKSVREGVSAPFSSG